eukprot:8398593-Karenia_brevis.AAC.1
MGQKPGTDTSSKPQGLTNEGPATCATKSGRMGRRPGRHKISGGVLCLTKEELPAAKSRARV